MSHAAMNWALKQRGWKPSIWKVLVHLADRHNPDLGYSYPDQERLAAECEISRASLNRHLSELEEGGLVRRVAQKDPITRVQLNTRYYIAFDTDFATLDVVARVSICDTETRVSKTAKAVSHSSETLLTGKRTSKNPLTPLEGEDTQPQDVDPEPAGQFNRVWDLWPEKGRGSHDAAMGAWSRLSAGEQEALLAAAPTMAATMATRWFQHGSEIPNLTSMIRDKAFVDFSDNAPTIDDGGRFRITAARPEWQAWCTDIKRRHGDRAAQRLEAQGFVLTETRWPATSRPTGAVH